MPDDEQQAEDVDWSNVSDDMAKLILERGETYLKAQLEIALASDRRALTIASVFVTVGIGLIGAVITYFEKTHSWPILLSGFVTAACAVIGAIYAFWAARPIPFFHPGNHPKQWWPYRGRKLAKVIGGESQNVQEHLECNERCLAQNARALATGSRWVVSAPIIGFIVWCISLYFVP
jgi:hypothetical protein